MTEKRFVNYFDKDHNYIIQDLQNEDEYQVGFVNCDEDELLELLNALHEENQSLKSIKNKYKGQRNYLLWAMERLLPKEVFEEQKGYLQEVEDLE